MSSAPTPRTRSARGRTPGNLTRGVRIMLVTAFVAIAALGLWHSQVQSADALTPTPGVWPRWALWPCLVLLLIIVTQLPRRWPKRLRQVGAVCAILTLLPTAVVVDAAVGAVYLDQVDTTVNHDQGLRRAMRRVNVVVNRRSVNVISPAAAFSGGMRTDSVSDTRRYEPDGVYAATRPFHSGEQVRVRIDPAGTLYPRLIPRSGQSGYLPWFSRSQPVSIAAGIVLLVGWGWILTACAGVVLRGPISSLDD